MTTNTAREVLQAQRVQSEKDGLLYDVSTLKSSLPENTSIRHHVQQFEDLCYWMFSRLHRLYEVGHWSFEESTFNSLIIRVLSGKWVLLRQVALQRNANSPYLGTLGGLDHFADDCYQRLLSAMQKVCDLPGLSASSPLAYLGPMARIFVFDEKAPCLISVPFGAAHASDEAGQELCRQVIPHEASHAIFEQISGLIDELRSKAALHLATSDASVQQRCIHPSLLRWLDEILADMAGTALAGEGFARSASVIMIMPEKTVGLTDNDHPIPLIRPFIHAWVLRKTHPESASNFEAFLDDITKDHIDKQFESLPAVVSVTIRDVRDELYKLVDFIWGIQLETLKKHSLGDVLGAINNAEIRSMVVQGLPFWGTPQKSDDEFIFRLVGGSMPGSPLPSSPLYYDLICCPLRWDFCCTPG